MLTARTVIRRPQSNVPSLELAAGDATATVQLFRDVAPNTCEAILSRLPLEGRLTHAKNCDGEVIFMLPFIFDGHENLTVPKPGFLFVWRYTLCIWYGPTTIEPLPNSFGRITSNLPGFLRLPSQSGHAKAFMSGFLIAELSADGHGYLHSQ